MAKNKKIIKFVINNYVTFFAILTKNISNEIRATSSGEMFINGLKVKAISGVDSSRLKIKSKK